MSGVLLIKNKLIKTIKKFKIINSNNTSGLY